MLRTTPHCGPNILHGLIIDRTTLSSYSKRINTHLRKRINTHLRSLFSRFYMTRCLVKVWAMALWCLCIKLYNNGEAWMAMSAPRDLDRDDSSSPDNSKAMDGSINPCPTQSFILAQIKVILQPPVWVHSYGFLKFLRSSGMSYPSISSTACIILGLTFWNLSNLQPLKTSLKCST